MAQIIKIDNMQSALRISIIKFSTPSTALVSTNRFQLQVWQLITAILAASSEDILLIGQFLLSPTMSKPIRFIRLAVAVSDLVTLTDNLSESNELLLSDRELRELFRTIYLLRIIFFLFLLGPF